MARRKYRQTRHRSGIKCRTLDSSRRTSLRLYCAFLNLQTAVKYTPHRIIDRYSRWSANRRVSYSPASWLLTTTCLNRRTNQEIYNRPIWHVIHGAGARRWTAAYFCVRICTGCRECNVSSNTPWRHFVSVYMRHRDLSFNKLLVEVQRRFVKINLYRFISRLILRESFPVCWYRALTFPGIHLRHRYSC